MAVNYKVLLIIAVCVAGVAYYACPVFPSSASNHALKTMVGLGFKVINVVSKAGGLLGFSPINITRTMLSAVHILDKDPEHIDIYTTTMDGVEVMIFKPAGNSKELRPGILHYHGGGWVHLSPKAYSPLLQELAHQTQSVIVSVNYRLAPEYPYPIPLEDCLTASRYFLRNARKYGVDETRIGIKGDSAGGNLAMAAALKLSKESDLPPLRFMSLDYPVLQMFDFNLPSYQKYEHGPGFCTKRIIIIHALLYAFGHADYFDLLHEDNHLTQELRDSYLAQYVHTDLLPPHIQSDAFKDTKDGTNDISKPVDIPKQLTEILTDPYFAPLLASDEDLKLLPPTYIFNAEFDVLRDEGFLLAERLRRLGKTVKTTHLVTEEHGFLNFLPIDINVQKEIENFVSFFNDMVK